MSRTAAALALVLAAGPALAAGPFPARDGHSGLLDVPDAEAQGVGNLLLGADLRLDLPKVGPADLGPLPVSVVGGLSDRLDLGFSLREWGQPGDPRPARFTLGAAAKYQLLQGSGFRPALALGLGGDRLNLSGLALGQARLMASTALAGRLRLAAFVGGEGLGASGTKSGLTAGLALSVLHRSGAEAVAEALTGPRGADFGAAIRWTVSPTVGLSLGVNWLPDDGVRVSAGIAFAPPPRPKRVAAPEAAPAPAAAPEEAPAALALTEERPHFRLRIRQPAPDAQGEPGHLQYAPYAPPAASNAPPRIAPPPRAGVPSAGDVLDAQLREQEALAEARLKRLRASEDALADREVALRAEVRRLELEDVELQAREQQLEAREKRIVLRGAPTQQLRQLESQEAQLAAAERQIAATERGFSPSLDAALGTERDAAAREQEERSEVERLGALAALERAKARQVEQHRLALAARQRMLAAMEGRLVAKGERLETAEKQLRSRGERLETWQRRLEARAERLEVLEKRASAQARPSDVDQARSAAPAAPQPGQDRSVFVMIVKSPTAIMKEPSQKAVAGAEGREAVHPGVSVEKAVAAATVVTFATPGARISELDRESIDAIARLAARESCELLIWARAKDPSLMGEAVRRSEEIKSYVMTTAALSAKQVVTRITTRPGAQGVDVVISALREGGKAGTPAPAAPAAGEVGGPAAGKLGAGETARRQIREAVVAVQPALERCVSEHMVRRGLTRADGTLQLSVDAAGRITGVASGTGALGGPELEACLRLAAGGWRFPPADAEYVVDVPITVLGGAGR